MISHNYPIFPISIYHKNPYKLRILVSLLAVGELYLFLFDPVLDLLVHALQKLVLLVYPLYLVDLSLRLLDALQLHPLSPHSRHQLSQFSLRFFIQCLCLAVFVLYALFLKESAGL